MLAGQVCGAGTQNAATSYISFVLSFVDTYLTFQIQTKSCASCAELRPLGQVLR